VVVAGAIIPRSGGANLAEGQRPTQLVETTPEGQFMEARLPDTGVTCVWDPVVKQGIRQGTRQKRGRTYPVGGDCSRTGEIVIQIEVKDASHLCHRHLSFNFAVTCVVPEVSLRRKSGRPEVMTESTLSTSRRYARGRSRLRHEGVQAN